MFKKAGNFLTFGALDRREAKKIVRGANSKRDEVKDELDEAKERTSNDIERLGELKEQVYNGAISNFIKSYEVIGKVDLKPLKKDKALNYKKFKTDYKEMKVVTTSIKEISTTVAGGAVVGATAALGAMGAVGLLGIATTATTGTVIGTLSGAAASKATLAWLGGGAISAGGSGVAGGMVVLGGIALAPVVIFGMFLGTNKGTKALNEAKNYSDEIDVLVEKVITLIAELSQIRRGCHMMSETIISLNILLESFNKEIEKIAYRLNQRPVFSRFFLDPIKNKVFNIDILTDKEAEIFRMSANVSKVLSEVVQMPLMNEEGAFISNSLEVLQESNKDYKSIKLKAAKQNINIA